MVFRLFLLTSIVLLGDSFKYSAIRAPILTNSAKKSSKMDSKVEEMDIQVSAMKKNVVDVRSQVKGLMEKIDELEGSKEDNTQSISSLEQHVDKVEENIGKTLAKLNTTLITVENEVTSIIEGKDSSQVEKDELKGKDSNQVDKEELNGKDSNQVDKDELKGISELKTCFTHANNCQSFVLKGKDTNQVDKEELQGKDSIQVKKDEFKGARSCLEVKKCGKVDQDGEYYLYPSALKGQRVKIYCGNMSTSSPNEYITLPNLNYGNYPKTCNLNCQGETTKGCPKDPKKGYVEYGKIRVDLETMTVDEKDQTFANGNGNLLHYGAAGDCYNTIWGTPDPPDMTCGPKGEFLLDITGTGFRFNRRTSWKKEGYRAFHDFTWSDDKKTILGICGGWSGQCNPKKIYLDFVPGDKVLDQGVQDIRCVQ